MRSGCTLKLMMVFGSSKDRRKLQGCLARLRLEVTFLNFPPNFEMFLKNKNYKLIVQSVEFMAKAYQESLNATN